MSATRAAAIALGLGCLGCPDTVVPNHTPPPLGATALVTGVVWAPNGQPAVAQLVYVFSNFTASCSPAAPMVSFVRTNAAGAFRFDHVVAPTEGSDLCVTILVIPETNTGFAESGRLNGFVDFRAVAPIDTVSFDVVLAPR